MIFDSVGIVILDKSGVYRLVKYRWRKNNEWREAGERFVWVLWGEGRGFEDVGGMVVTENLIEGLRGRGY